MENVIEFAVQLFVLERSVLQCILRHQTYFTKEHLKQEIINETMRFDGPIHAIEDFVVLNRGLKKFEESLNSINPKYKNVFLRNIQLFYKLVSEDKQDEFWKNSVSCFLNFAYFQDFISGEITFEELISNPIDVTSEEDSQMIDYDFSNLDMSQIVHVHIQTTSQFRIIIQKLIDSHKIS
jgi:hypothetical protein